VNVDPRLGAIAAAQPFPLVFATLSGAHLYGFESADSDFDLRGVHVLPVRDVIGLDHGPDTLQVSELREGLDLDLVSHDVGKFCGLLLRNNGYVLEQLYSPLVVSGGEPHEELKSISAGCITRNHAHHYLGFADTQWRLYGKTHQLKPLLYTFRVLKTGIHLMRTGRVEANLVHLLDEEPRIAYIGDLVSDKQAHGEHALVTDERAGDFDTDIPRLREVLAAESVASLLPGTTAARPALHDFVVRVRLATS
jgi:predicted nucleotidyltransferase